MVTRINDGKVTVTMSDDRQGFVIELEASIEKTPAFITDTEDLRRLAEELKKHAEVLTGRVDHAVDNASDRDR